MSAERERPESPARRQAELSATDWAVLGLLGERPTHGFALAASLEPDGDLGRVWAVPRPIVYQAIRRLRDAGLVIPVATESSATGPDRTILTITPAGRERLALWLDEPVGHVRDIRSLFLLKLALLDRRGRSLRPLAERQREALRPALDALRREVRQAQGFDQILASWRLSSHRAAETLLETLLQQDPPGPSRRRGESAPPSHR